MTVEKLRLREIVVVEGLHDAQAVQNAADADVWVIGGDRVARKFLMELQRAERGRGVIVLTDPDGPGERIRQRIANAIPSGKHAFIAKHLALGKGKVGVEHADAETIREALLKAKATLTDTRTAPEYTVTDLLEAGLLGRDDAAKNRALVGDILGVGSGNAKGLLRKLNSLGITREEWSEAVRSVHQKHKGE